MTPRIARISSNDGVPSSTQLTRRSWLKAATAVVGAAAFAGPRAARAAAADFFAPKGRIPDALPARKLYPQGRTFLVSGIAGIPSREKTNGFTAFGPVYGDQSQAYDAAHAAGLPFLYRLGIPMNFLEKNGRPKLVKSETEIKEEIGRQLKAVVQDETIPWWYLTPEEMRHWNEDEMAYLRVATETIHALDPLKRPVWMYEPNHRTAESLVKTGRYLDIFGKGFYANYSGYKHARVFIRWSMEQQTEAIRQVGHGIPIVVPEMFRDPNPEDFHLIPSWVRHDVYLGLMFGGKAVVVYTLVNRKQIEKSHDTYYRAFAEVAKELTGPRALGQVFLFGETTDDLVCRQVSGRSTVLLAKGDPQAEAGTSTKSELQRGERSYPALSCKTLALRRDRWLFLCNSSEAGIAVEVSGYPWPASFKIEDGFAGRTLHQEGFARMITGPVLRMELKPLEVKCLKFSLPGAPW